MIRKHSFAKQFDFFCLLFLSSYFNYAFLNSDLYIVFVQLETFHSPDETHKVKTCIMSCIVVLLKCFVV